MEARREGGCEDEASTGNDSRLYAIGATSYGEAGSPYAGWLDGVESRPCQLSAFFPRTIEGYGGGEKRQSSIEWSVRSRRRRGELGLRRDVVTAHRMDESQARVGTAMAPLQPVFFSLQGQPALNDPKQPRGGPLIAR